MNVLHVLAGFHTAGIEQLALQLVRHAPAGIELAVLNIKADIQDFRAPFEAVAAERPLTITDWPALDGPALALRTTRLCRQLRPDAVIIYPCNRRLLWAALGARLAGVNTMAVTIQNTAPDDPHGKRTWRRLLLWFQRLGVLAVPCTEAIVRTLQPLPPSLRLGPVIPNACDVRAIAQRAERSRSQRSAEDCKRVLMVARLDPIKDQETLLRAFAATRMPGWELQLVGEGPDRARLEQLALELGMDPSHVFLGRRSDIAELLGQADLFAFSTTSAEGFGIVLIEALAAGLPVLASDVPACREVLRDGAAGDLLPPKDEVAWQQRLGALMASSPERQALALKGQRHAGSFDIAKTAQQWYGLLQP